MRYLHEISCSLGSGLLENFMKLLVPTVIFHPQHLHRLRFSQKSNYFVNQISIQNGRSSRAHQINRLDKFSKSFGFSLDQNKAFKIVIYNM
jgi:hypothetical protein